MAESKPPAALNTKPGAQPANKLADALARQAESVQAAKDAAKALYPLITPPPPSTPASEA